MSHAGLQLALGIALHDEGFLDRLAADDGSLQRRHGLTDAELAQLGAVDRRALRTDPLRRRRVLRVLADEYKAATTLLLAESRRLALAEGFFASDHFRSALLDARPFAVAFGAYLLDDVAPRLGTPQLREVILVEHAMAVARRGPRQPPERGVRLRSGISIVRVSPSTIDVMQAVERWLFELSLMPQAALCDDRPTLPPLPPPGEPAPLLVTPAGTGASITPIDDELARVLERFGTSWKRSEAARALEGLVPAGRADALVQSLLEEGLLAEGLPLDAELLA